MKACFTIPFLCIFCLISASQRDDGINGLEVRSVNNLSWDTFDCFAQNGYKLAIIGASGIKGEKGGWCPIRVLRCTIEQHGNQFMYSIH